MRWMMVTALAATGCVAGTKGFATTTAAGPTVAGGPAGTPAGAATTDAPLEDDVSLADDELVVVEPGEGLDRAAVTGRPSWCGERFGGEIWDKHRLRRAMPHAAYMSLSEIAAGAAQLCQWAYDPTWQKQAGYVVQAWMNIRKTSQVQAEQELRERIAKLAERE